jgi:hypothetical protein
MQFLKVIYVAMYTLKVTGKMVSVQELKAV